MFFIRLKMISIDSPYHFALIKALTTWSQLVNCLIYLNGVNYINIVDELEITEYPRWTCWTLGGVLDVLFLGISTFSNC